MIPIWIVARNWFRLTGEAGEDGAAARAGLETLQLAFAQRDEGELGAGERGVDDDQDDDQAELG